MYVQTFVSTTVVHEIGIPEFWAPSSARDKAHMGPSSARAPTLLLKNASGWMWSHKLILSLDYSAFANQKHELCIAIAIARAIS